jgi:MazG family protein
LSLADALLELQQLTERLRRDCPWDREQTVRTIVPHTVEEAYEVADAALADRPDKLLDEQGQGDLERAARGIHDKLVARHPHVFGDAEAKTAGRVRERWEQLKAEQEGREGIFHDVPETLPALLLARKVQRRAVAVGFEYPDVAGALDDLRSELAEVEAELAGRAEPAPESPPDERVAEELGDLLFATVNVARRLNVDPELELRRASERFVARVERAEQLASDSGERFAELDLAQQDRYFDRAKEEL